MPRVDYGGRIVSRAAVQRLVRWSSSARATRASQRGWVIWPWVQGKANSLTCPVQNSAHCAAVSTRSLAWAVNNSKSPSSVPGAPAAASSFALCLTIEAIRPAWTAERSSSGRSPPWRGFGQSSGHLRVVGLGGGRVVDPETVKQRDQGNFCSQLLQAAADGVREIAAVGPAEQMIGAGRLELADGVRVALDGVLEGLGHRNPRDDVRVLQAVDRAVLVDRAGEAAVAPGKAARGRQADQWVKRPGGLERQDHGPGVGPRGGTVQAGGELADGGRFEQVERRQSRPVRWPALARLRRRGGRSG